MQRRLTLLLVVGIVLLVAAAVLATRGGLGGWATALLGVGGLAWSLAVLASWRQITLYLTKRSTRYGLNAVLLSFLVGVVLILVGFLGDRHAWRRDYSSTGEFTLSEKTVNVLQGIRRQVDVYVYYERDARDPVKDLLVEYSRRNRNIRVHLEDMNKNPELAEHYGVTDMGTIVLDAGDKAVRLRAFGEEELTNGLIKVSRPGQKKIYFLSGHGEKSIDEKGVYGYSTASSTLQRENYETLTLSLTESGDVPADCDILVVAGAKSGFLDQELEAVQRYLQGGGRLFVLFDPLFRSGLEGFVGRWGIQVGEDRVVDPSPMGQILGRGYTTPLVNRYGVHPITKQFREPTYYQNVRSVRRLQLYGGKAETSSLAFSGPDSWAETDVTSSKVSHDQEDLPGPVSIAMASRLDLEGLHPDLEPALSRIPGQEIRSGEALSGAGGQGSTEARLVVFGDSDFANNQNFNDMGNGNLFLNSVAWLAEDEDLIALRPKASRVRSVSLTVAQVRLLNLMAIGVLPALVAGIGLLATLRRRSRG